MKKHVHCELIKAWADGAEIQWQDEDGAWHDIETPTWGCSCQYRIKPRIVKRGGMRTDRELLQAARAAIECGERPNSALIEEIADRLAELEDEPDQKPYMHIVNHEGRIPLYRHPRQPVRLSDEEICEIAETSRVVEGKAMLPVTFARDIEKAIWEKSQ